jgi:Uncharacterized protein conserved in bacteria
LIVAAAAAFVFGYIPFLHWDWGKKTTTVSSVPAELKTETAAAKEKTIFSASRPEVKPPSEPAKATPEPASKPASAPESKPQKAEVNSPVVALVPDPNSRVNKLIDQAMANINANPARIIEARDLLNAVLAMPLSGQQRSFVKEQLSQLSDKWLFSKTIHTQDKLCGSYKVEPGDLLSTIGKQFNVPYDILMEINKIARPEALQAGETIKIINGPFHVRVYRTTFTMDLYLQNTFVRSFPVGLGKSGMDTPMGLWVVKSDGKMISPKWTDSDTGRVYKAEDPDYPLGSRWIALEGLEGAAKGRTGFAIHGTKDIATIGTSSSRGCIRLYNGNVILLYNLLMPGVSQVEVVD